MRAVLLPKKSWIALFVLTLLNCNNLKAQELEFEWVRHFESENHCLAMAIATDNAGNSYVTGHFTGTVDFDPGSGTYNLTATSTASSDVFVAKLNSLGSLIWVKQISSIGRSSIQANSIAIEPDGFVYTTGIFKGIVDFDPGPDSFLLTGEKQYGGFVFKLSANGSFVWARKIGDKFLNNDQLHPFSIAIGDDCQLHISGGFVGEVSIGSYQLKSQLSDAFICKLDSAGNIIWVRNIGGAGSDEFHRIAVSPSGHVYACGKFEKTVDFDPGPAVYNLTSQNPSMVIVKLTSTGHFIWAKQIKGQQGEILTNGLYSALKLDDKANIYTMGTYKGDIDFDPGPGIKILSTIGPVLTDFFCLKLDSSGNFIWVRNGGASGYSGGTGLAVANNGEVVATTYNSIIVMSADGTPLIEKELNGKNLQSGVMIRGVSGDSNNNIYTTGEFRGRIDFDPGPNIFELATLSPMNPINIFVHKLGYEEARRISLGPDTMLCNGDTLVLFPEILNGDKILWNTGDTTPTLTITQSGTYYITVTAGALTFSDTIEVTFAPKPTVYIGPDTAFCGLVDHLLDPQTTNAQKFQWNTGDTTKTLHINSDGIYSLTVSSEHSCHNADTVYIDKIDYPYPPGQQDTTICGGSSHILNAKNPGSTYQWSTGETSQTITVTESGLYSVTISNGFCSITDSVNVQFVPEEDCSKELRIFFPNAFTPYGHNPLFKAEGANVAGWSIKIFSRWGELLYTTTNFAEGWDGTYKGIACPEGVYVYIAEARGIEGERKVHKGSVMLMR